MKNILIYLKSMKTIKDINSSNPEEIVNLQVELTLKDDLKIIATETGLKLKELSSRVVRSFVNDYKKDKRTFTKMSASLLNNSK